MDSRNQALLTQAIGFSFAAALTRYLIFDIETRMQIAAFVVLAAVWGWTNRRSGLVGFIVNSVASAAAIIAVRWWLEGLCPGVHVVACLPGSP